MSFFISNLILHNRAPFEYFEKIKTILQLNKEAALND